MKDLMKSWQAFLNENDLYEEVYDLFYKEGLRPTWGNNAARQVVELVKKGHTKEQAIEEVREEL